MATAPTAARKTPKNRSTSCSIAPASSRRLCRSRSGRNIAAGAPRPSAGARRRNDPQDHAPPADRGDRGPDRRADPRACERRRAAAETARGDQGDAGMAQRERGGGARGGEGEGKLARLGKRATRHCLERRAAAPAERVVKGFSRLRRRAERALDNPFGRRIRASVPNNGGLRACSFGERRMTPARLSPSDLKAMLADRIDELACCAAPDGKRKGRYWLAHSPLRIDKEPSF